jgi:Tol biopolymer transport system component
MERPLVARRQAPRLHGPAARFGQRARRLRHEFRRLRSAPGHSLRASDGRAQWPVWSPDGRELAIQVNDLEAHSCHIWIVNAATGDARKLAAHAEPYLDETPSWFPDGKRIAFQSNRTGRMEVWVMNADGSSPRQVTGAK